MTRVGLAALLVVGCSSETTTQMQLAGAEAPAEAHAVVWLWGYDELLADASASLVRAYHMPYATTLELEIPEKPHELIEQGRGTVSADRARFYFSVYVDVDNDQQLCPGDLRQDHDVSGFMSYETPPSTLTIALEVIDSSFPCKTIVPETL